MKLHWILTLGSQALLFSYSLELEYSCDTTGLITMVNPNSTFYVGAFAQTADETLNCTVNLNQTASTITIDDCPVSTNLTLYLMNTTEVPEILTGELDYHTIQCEQLPATGVYRVVTDNSWVTNELSTSLAPSVTPKIILQTQIEDIDSGLKRETAIVGEPLLWEIDGPGFIPKLFDFFNEIYLRYRGVQLILAYSWARPAILVAEGYTILPLNCTAESGTGSDVVNIVLNGCSLDTYLLSHFEYAVNTTTNVTYRHVLQADLWAFRFADNEDVIITCAMLGCVNESTACDFTCPSKRRKRDDNFDTKEVHWDQPEQVAERMSNNDQFSDSVQRINSDPSDKLKAAVSVSLTVYDSDLWPFSIGKGSKGVPSFVLVTVIAIAVLSTT